MTLYTDPCILYLVFNTFCDTKHNFHCEYLDTDWGMRTVSFAGVGTPLMVDIPVYGMMEKLQRSHPESRGELVEMLGIYLNWIMHQFSDGQISKTCEDSDWSDMTIQGAFIR